MRFTLLLGGDGRRRLFHCRYLATYLCRRYRGATLRKLSIEIGLFHPDRGLLGRTLRDTTYFFGVVANRIGNFYAGVILYFLVSVLRRSESWREWLVLKFSTRRRSLPYTSSEKRSALATPWDSMNGSARISIIENASLGTTWHRADTLVRDGEGFWKSVYERSRNGKECFGGSQS